MRFYKLSAFLFYNRHMAILRFYFRYLCYLLFVLKG